MGMIDKLSYQLLKKNEYIGDFNEEYQIGEKPIGLKKKLVGAAYMLTHLYHPKYRSEIFEPQVIKAYDFDVMKKKIDAADVISFDIFDTLLLRPVYQPRDMFYFLEKDNRVIDFRKKRVRAEEWARNHTDKENGEINIFDIYHCLEEWCGIDAEKSAIEEIEVEKKYCFAHPFVKKMYQYALDNHKTVIATSDMYIPKEYMKEILADNDYDNFNAIFVSCDYEKSKYNGELYELVKKKFGEKKILHIGDNRYSDILVAKKYGLSTIHIQNVNRAGEKYRRFQHQSFSQSVYCGLVDSFLYSGIIENVEKCSNPFFMYGFLCGGPLVFGLCNWIDKLAMERKCDKILFLARDGFIVSEIYKNYFNHVDSEYVLASRQALLPVICCVDFEMYLQEAFYKRIVYSKMSVKDALYDVGLYQKLDEGLTKELEKIFTDKNIEWNDFKTWMLNNKNTVKALYANDLLAFNRYFDNLIQDSKKICIFDLGWRGTSILYLKKYLEMKYENVHVQGAMFGVQEMPMTYLWTMQHDIEAYAFSEENPSVFSRIKNQKIMYSKERFMLEFLFSSTDTSLVCYKLKGDCYDFEYEKGENNSNSEKVFSMHNGIRTYIEKYREYVLSNDNNLFLYTNIPMWQVLNSRRIKKLSKCYKERPTTLHGYLGK